MSPMIETLKSYLSVGDVNEDLKNRMMLAGFKMALSGKGFAFFDTMVEYNQVENGPTEYFKMLVSMDYDERRVTVRIGYDDGIEPEYFEVLPWKESDVVGWMKRFLDAQLQPGMKGKQKYFHEDVASYPEAFEVLIVKAEAMQKCLAASPEAVAEALKHEDKIPF